MKYFESHAHYDDEAFDADRDELLSSLPDFSVGVIVNAGANVESSLRAAALADKYDYIFSAAGVHPHDANKLNQSGMEALAGLCDLTKTVAVGETGLDYYYDLSPRDLQKKWFLEQISLAIEKKLPIIVHSRDAEADTLSVIKQAGAKRVGGVIHCFSGSAETAAEYVKLGFYIGVGGVVTYKNAKKLIEVVKKTPLEHILIETDCPYLSPEPFRGRRNDSRNLERVVAKIAEIKGVTAEAVAKATFENGSGLFGTES